MKFDKDTIISNKDEDINALPLIEHVNLILNDQYSIKQIDWILSIIQSKISEYKDLKWRKEYVYTYPQDEIMINMLNEEMNNINLQMSAYLANLIKIKLDSMQKYVFDENSSRFDLTDVNINKIKLEFVLSKDSIGKAYDITSQQYKENRFYEQKLFIHKEQNSLFVSITLEEFDTRYNEMGLAAIEMPIEKFNELTPETFIFELEDMYELKMEWESMQN